VTAALLGLLAATAPVAVTVVQEEADLGLPTWILGVIFPWFLGRALAHQVRLAGELDATRRELAEQALLDERRRIARDVHEPWRRGSKGPRRSSRNSCRREWSSSPTHSDTWPPTGKTTARTLSGTPRALTASGR
jgi:hypothetical protein